MLNLYGIDLLYVNHMTKVNRRHFIFSAQIDIYKSLQKTFHKKEISNLSYISGVECAVCKVGIEGMDLDYL